MGPVEQLSTCSWTLSSSRFYWFRLPGITMGWVFCYQNITSKEVKEKISSNFGLPGQKSLLWCPLWSWISYILSCKIDQLEWGHMHIYNISIKFLNNEHSHWQISRALLLSKLTSGTHWVLEDLEEDVVKMGGDVRCWDLILQNID